MRCVVFVPEAETLSSVHASYGRLARALTAAADQKLAAHILAYRGSQWRQLTALEQYYRLKLNKMAATLASSSSSSDMAGGSSFRSCGLHSRSYLRRRLPVGLCALDFCCLETRQSISFFVNLIKHFKRFGLFKSQYLRERELLTKASCHKKRGLVRS